MEISRLESLLTVLPDNQAIYREWRNVVLDNSVLGKQVHDARIVAAMNVHQITKLLTFNTRDFKRFGHITLIDPNTIQGRIAKAKERVFVLDNTLPEPSRVLPQFQIFLKKLKRGFSDGV